MRTISRLLACDVAVCWSVLQCDAVCCSVLQCVAMCRSVSQCVAVCRSVLQCDAVCCSVLQVYGDLCGCKALVFSLYILRRCSVPSPDILRYINIGAI